MHIEKLGKGIVLFQDDILSNLFLRVFLVKEVVKFTDHHERNEILGDVEDGERLGDDDIVVQECDQHDRSYLEKSSGKSDLVIRESPVMVQRILHLCHALFQLSGHGYMHHDAGNESCKSDVTGRHWNLIERVIIVLIYDEREQRDLKDKDEGHLCNEHDLALFHDKAGFNETLDVFVLSFSYETSKLHVCL